MDTFTRFFSKYKTAVVALSGGADSAAVLMLAVRHMGRENVSAATCVNHHVFRYETVNAKKIAAAAGVRHIEFEAEMTEDFLRGGDERCYHCKKAIMGRLTGINGCGVIFDGTSADDNPAERPGTKVLAEYGIVSPLKEMGLGRDFVMAQVAGLDIAFHSESCIATRLTGSLDKARMDKVEKFEDKLRDSLPGIRYRIDDGYIEFKKPLTLKYKDFRLINDVKHSV